MSAEPEYLVVDLPESSRFALRKDGDDIGFAAYRRGDGAIVFTHTEIDESQQERGLGSRLAAGALDAVRVGSEDRVIAQCPFIARFVSQHPEYQDLLERGPEERRAGISF
jgi:uncharacterized protein